MSTNFGSCESVRGLGRIRGRGLRQEREEGQLANQFQLWEEWTQELGKKAKCPSFLPVADHPMPRNDPRPDESSLDHQEDVKTQVGADGSC